MGEKNPQKLADVGVRTFSLIISMRKWITDENGQSESAAVGTRKRWLGPRFPLPLFVRTWKGRAFPTTFKTGLRGLPEPQLLPGPLHGCGGDVMLQNPAQPDRHISGTCMRILRQGRKRKKEKLISPRQTWSQHHTCAPGATRPTAVILKLGHKIIWSYSHQAVEATCFPWVWAGSDAMWLMQPGQEMLRSFALECLGSLLRLPPLGIWPLSSEKPKPQSYRERLHEGGLQDTGPALSPTFKTRHKSWSAGAAQGWD